MPRCRYPITTSQSTTRSPSSLSTTRSTPWVLGCCGPMLMTSSSVSKSDWLMDLLDVGGVLVRPQLQPFGRVFHQQLARSLERIVLPLRMPLPLVGHQDPPQVGMPREAHPEHVPHLALEPVGCGPHA